MDRWRWREGRRRVRERRAEGKRQEGEGSPADQAQRHRASGVPGSPPACTVRALFLQRRREKGKLHSRDRVEAARSRLRGGQGGGAEPAKPRVYPVCRRGPTGSVGWEISSTQHRKLQGDRQLGPARVRFVKDVGAGRPGPVGTGGGAAPASALTLPPGALRPPRPHPTSKHRRPQSFSWAVLSSEMPWAASSASTLSR